MTQNRIAKTSTIPAPPLTRQTADLPPFHFVKAKRNSATFSAPLRDYEVVGIPPKTNKPEGHTTASFTKRLAHVEFVRKPFLSAPETSHFKGLAICYHKAVKRKGSWISDLLAYSK